jgi:SHS2 domain-containing protein
MPYRYLEEIALADAAFEAWGSTPEEMIVSASDATVNIMVRDIEKIRGRQYRHLRISETPLDMLLFQLLQEIIYYKDAEELLLRMRNVRLEQNEDLWTAYAELAGEPINRRRHDLLVDIKAVTLHQFEVRQTGDAWIASVIVDV